MPYHDETIAQAVPSHVELCKSKVEYFMQLSAKLAGFKVGASAKSGKSWLEAH